MKKIVTLLFVAALLFATASAVEAPSVNAPSAILIERTSGTVLYEKNSRERLAPASVTKVMTLLLAIEAIEAGKVNFEDQVTTSDYAASMGGSQIYLEPGETMSLHDMLKSIAVCSANDACVAVGEFLMGSEGAFVDVMNARAQELGMLDTHFDNCCGLDSETHYTTAYDISLMSRELLKHDQIKEFTTIWMDTVRNGEFGLTNTNKLVRFYDGTTGLKTGFTSKAGYCVSASAKRGGMELIAVIMKSDTSPHRNADASGLLNYGFANYALVGFDETDESPMPVSVEYGVNRTVKVELSDDARVLVAKGDASRVEKQIKLSEGVVAPVEKGQKLGSVTFTLDGALLTEVPLVAAEEVARLTTGDIFNSLIGRVFLEGEHK